MALAFNMKLRLGDGEWGLQGAVGNLKAPRLRGPISPALTKASSGGRRGSSRGYDCSRGISAGKGACGEGKQLWLVGVWVYGAG